LPRNTSRLFDLQAVANWYRARTAHPLIHHDSAYGKQSS
jgi:hypothetical protein